MTNGIFVCHIQCYLFPLSSYSSHSALGYSGALEPSTRTPMKYSLQSLMLLVTLCGIVIPWTAMLVARFLVEVKAWLDDSFAWK